MVAFAPLDVVKEKFEKLFDILCKYVISAIFIVLKIYFFYFKIAPLNTLRYVENMVSEDMKKKYKEHTMKTLEYVDKLSKVFFSLEQTNE